MDLPLHETIHLPPETRATALTLTATGRTALRVEVMLGLARKATPSHAVYFGYAVTGLNNAVAE